MSAKYEERIERALLNLDGPFPDGVARVEAIVAAFLGDDEAFIICPDCNGMGTACVMDVQGNETEYVCHRCTRWQGMVPLKGETP